MKLFKQQLALRPRLYGAAGAALVAGLFSLVFVALLVMDQLHTLDNIQSGLGRKVQGLALDTRNILLRLNQNHVPDCSEANLRRLRQEVFTSSYQSDIGVLDARQRLLCTTVMGLLPEPVQVSPPDAIVRSQQGEEHYLNFRLPLLVSGGSIVATVVRQGRFNTVINPQALDDLFAIDEGILRVQMIDGTYHLVHADAALAPAVVDGLGQGPWLERNFHGYSWRDRAFISSRQIAGTRYLSQFVVPLERVWAEYAQRLGVALLLVLMAATLVYGTLVPLLQRWGRLDHRIAGLIREENMLCMYQPIVDMQTGRPVGCEVLMRLRDGADVLYPDQVLPAVDRANLCWELDQAVVRRAIRELYHHLPASCELKVSFNFFPKNLDCARLRALIEGELARHPPRALRFDLEVIEQADQSRLLPEIVNLKQAGYLISIDDFGTGYSNLASVKALAPDVLKIDKSFVFEMEDASVRSSLIPEIISIARAVGAKVVAEGIENEAQHQRLLACGVDYGQGYLYARPMVVNAFVAYLQGKGVA